MSDLEFADMSKNECCGFCDGFEELSIDSNAVDGNSYIAVHVPANPGAGVPAYCERTTVDNLLSGIVIPPATPLATTLPVADNETNTAIRTGQIGTSAQAARADHNHPIQRQTAPARPTLLFNGPAGSTMPQVTNLDTWTEEETVTFAWRVRVDASATTGWNYITVPNLAGFQRPQITIEGTYRSTGNPSLTQPRAPYMGNEANHWSSTQRVYLGQYNQKTGTGRYYAAITVRYVRN